MAFIVDQNAPQQGVNQVGVQSAPVSSGGAGVAGGPTKAAATPGVNVPAQPSAQLSAYLQANQPQSSNLAGQIAGNLTGNVNAVQNAITPAVDIYTGQLNNVQDNPTLDTLVSTSPSQATAPVPTPFTPGPNDSTEIPNHPNPDIAEFQNELNASANAPSSTDTFETTQPYADLTSQIQNDVEQANLWSQGNNPASLATALTPYESSAATSGDITLDSLLLSQNPEAYSQIQSAIAPTGNLQGQLNAGAATADQYLNSAITNDQASTAAAQAAAQTFATNLTDYLTSQVANQTQQQQQQNQQILSDLTNNTPSPQDLTILGITPEQWQLLSSQMTTAAAPSTVNFNTNLGPQTVSAPAAPISLVQYLSQTQPNISAANIATPQNYEDVAALNNLVGANAPAEIISPATSNEALSAPTVAANNNFDFSAANLASLLNPLEAQGQALENYGNSTENQYTQNQFGGQTPQQYNTFITDLNGALTNINNQIQQLESTAPQFQDLASVYVPPPNNNIVAPIPNVPSTPVPITPIIPGISDTPTVPVPNIPGTPLPITDITVPTIGISPIEQTPVTPSISSSGGSGDASNIIDWLNNNVLNPFTSIF